MRLERYLQRLDAATARLEAFILAGGVLLLAGVSIANTLSRNLRGATIPGTVEVTEILLLWITFGGLAYAVRHARHIAMSAVYDQLRGRARKALLVTVSLGTAALLLYLGGYAVLYVLEVRAGGRVTTALGIPVWIAYAIVPLGLLLGAVQYALTAWRNLTCTAIYRAYNERERYEEPGP